MANAGPALQKQESLPLGVIVERRRIDHPWQEYSWRPVAVLPGAAAHDPAAAWKILREGDGWTRYLCGTLPLELFRKETESYKVNLSQAPPRVFVVLRPDDSGQSAHDVVPFLVTASPFEAQDYLDSGEEIVEAVPMPPDVIAFVQAYVDAHHVDEPFYKRKRKRHDPEKVGFGKTAQGRKGPRHG